MITILSIDGGGIRGIIPAAFLVEIERQTGKPVCELFDLIAGTSTGGILAAALTVSAGQGKPKFTAAQIRQAYFDHGGAIFHKSLVRRIRTLNGLIRPAYSPRVLEDLAGEFLGKARLHSTLTDIIVTAYDMASSTPWFFKTSFAMQNRDPADDPLLSQVVLSTSAAPTYFPPHIMEGHCMIDGGVFAANPALCAYAEARNRYPLERDILVVSLGTGLSDHDRPCSKVKNWGIAGWAAPISSVMLNSSSATVNYQMRALVGDEKYVRFQVSLDKSAEAMDDASPENLERLDEISKRALEDNAATLAWLCRILKKRRAA